MDAVLRAAAEAAPGFMPPDEGMALYAAAYRAAVLGPLVEIGTYFVKSTIYLAAAAVERGTVVVTVDHDRGSEEHQPGWGVPRSEPRRSRYRPDRYPAHDAADAACGRSGGPR